MRISNRIVLILLTLIFFSCDEKRVFDEYKSVGRSWHKDSLVAFDLPILDSTKRYNLFVTLRNNNDYPFNNLFLIVDLEMPNGFTKIDTLEYEMSYPDGTLMGEGFFNVKESKLFYKDNVRFRGKYKVNIKQAVRENGKVPGVTALDGITEVGFRIENIE